MKLNESILRRVAIGVISVSVIATHANASLLPTRLGRPGTPPVEALIYCTMPSTREHRPEMAMDGDANTSFQTTAGMDDGDTFLVLLSRPINVRAITVQTGDEDHNELLNDAILETSPDQIHFNQAASFGKDGIASGSWRRRSVSAIRIRVNAHRSVPKLVIKEISVQGGDLISHVQYGPGRGFSDISQAPDLAKWADIAEKQMESFWPDTAAMLYSYGLITPNMVNVVYKTGPGVTGVAATGGGVMTVNSKWCRAHPEDTGLTVHEMAHVVQCINAAAPGWLVEGTADYIRWVKFEPEHFKARINVAKATYHDAYQTSATFLAWCVNHYDSQLITKFSDAARKGKYRNSLFKDYCGKDVDTLWTEFIEAYKKDPTRILQNPHETAIVKRKLPEVTAGTSQSVDLSSLFNVIGVTSDHTRVKADGGFDGEGNTFPNQNVQEKTVVRNVAFNVGKPDAQNVLACRGQVIPLPSGSHQSLWILASSIEGSHRDQPITIRYTDGTSQVIQQSFSDWYVPEAFSGEVRAIRCEYRNTPDGTKDTRNFFVYAYGFNLDATKTLKDVTLPNDDGIRVLAVSTAG